MNDVIDLPLPAIKQELSFEEARGFTPEAARFLEDILWGSAGVLYTLRDLQPTLDKLPAPNVLQLRKWGKLIATHMTLAKTLAHGPALYSSMVAVDARYQHQGYGTLIARHAMFRHLQLLPSKGLMYAYIEAGNLPSQKVFHAMDYKKIAQFHATVYGRRSPRKSLRARLLTPGDEPRLRSLLKVQYADHGLTDFELSLIPKNYWVLMDGREILAGVQVDPQRWQIQSLPGLGGRIACRLLPRLPVLKDLFNPDDFRFLKLGNVYFQNGQTDAAFELFESLLAHYRVKAAMMYWDKRSPVYQALAASGHFGLLNLLGETPVDVLGRFQGFPAAEQVDFCERPLAISPLDI